MTLAERARLYNDRYPDRPPLVATDRWLYGVWLIGNNYRGSGYYGAYPPGYLDRVMSLFPDARPDRILHLFSGSLGPEVPGVRFDIRPGADIQGDAHELSRVAAGPWELIVADPPYSQTDAERYGTSVVNRRKIVAECARVAAPGGHLVWLDTVLPMYRKDAWTLVGTIALVRSTNHRVRMVFVFERAAEDYEPNSWVRQGGGE